MRQIVLLSILLNLAISAAGQTEIRHTMQLDSIQESPTASLEDLDWIVGSWEGTAFGGIAEEVWAPASGNSMMGMFKLISDGDVYFYELMTIVEQEGTLMMRLKHFNNDLTGWEEKDDTVDFPLVKVSENKVYFAGLTFEKVNKDEIVVYVLIGNEEGSSEEHGFNYTRK